MSDSTLRHSEPPSGSSPIGTTIPRPLILWYGLWGGPAAWSVQLLIDSPVAAHTCFPHQRPLFHPTLGALTAVSTVIGLVALAVAAGALVIATKTWLSLRRRTQPPSADELTDRHRSRALFMAASGMMIGALFTFGVLLNAISPTLVPACW
jgi:hypothetical protein